MVSGPKTGSGERSVTEGRPWSVASLARPKGVLGGARLPNDRLSFATVLTGRNESWATPRDVPSRERPRANFVATCYAKMRYSIYPTASRFVGGTSGVGGSARLSARASSGRNRSPSLRAAPGRSGASPHQITTASQARQRSTGCQPRALSLPRRGSISAANEGT